MKLSPGAKSSSLSAGLSRYRDEFRSASLLSKLTVVGLASAVLLSLLFAITRASDAPYRDLQPPVSQQPPQTKASDSSENAGNAAFEQLVGSRLEQWRQAWEQRNADLHLSFFHPSFENLDAYSQNRRKRIQEATSIEVAFSEISFKPGPGSDLAVSFVQSYKSDRFSDRVRKEQIWRSAANGPLIVSERVVRP